MADPRVDKAITLTLRLRGHRHYCPRKYTAMRAACLVFVSGEVCSSVSLPGGRLRAMAG
ncbi:hypothetical protein [Pseudomonas sp.]|jgi:hypothetical protein|uniref:hypothetical protein n=1 Tax=Pseudomonas sp. TaxID=306 RepID=UPI0037C9242F